MAHIEDTCREQGGYTQITASGHLASNPCSRHHPYQASSAEWNP
jgi:hypothetical protein